MYGYRLVVFTQQSACMRASIGYHEQINAKYILLLGWHDWNSSHTIVVAGRDQWLISFETSTIAAIGIGWAWHAECCTRACNILRHRCILVAVTVPAGRTRPLVLALAILALTGSSANGWHSV